MHEAAKTVRTLELMRYLLARYTLRESAKLLDVSYQTARKWASEDRFLEELKAASGEIWSEVSSELKKNTVNVQEKLLEQSERALDTLIELMEDKSQKGVVRQKAASEILDRVQETSKISKVNTSGQVQHKFDPIQLLHAAATAQEMEVYRAKQLQEKNG